MKGQTICFHEFGEPQDVLAVEQRVITPLEPDEILVEMIARPINPSDLIPIRGAYRHRISLPCIPGYEGVGLVIDTGSRVQKSMLGKRVLPLRGEGTWQQYVKTSSSLSIEVPNFITDDEASRSYINPLTAWIIFKELLKRSDNSFLLVNACSSAIGRIFAQLSVVFGYRLLAVVRSSEYTKELLQLGAWHVIDCSQSEVYKTVMDITMGQGVNAAIDSIGGREGYDLALTVRRGGLFLSIGLLSGLQVNWKRIAIELNIQSKIFHLRQWIQCISVYDWQNSFLQIFALLRQKQLYLGNIEARYNLNEITKAVKIAERLGRQGKLLLT
ncbi:zinc-dependent alcohol dehydrogenase family protein [Paenibacillus albidus]|uniref:zinc-dependent alcohol dehydrogenase family protein n=1 Tax=Paenibacillus albidus TaxID=2041023 RepID=UPI001BE690AD|nr:zinc-dependent alcohol dehydrogenase family protein [Paenibacillus albidus]MBT2293363.1 zinc-dependent alcohol dehydrogenase family protein [Paenibacillus albidus]